MGGGANPKRAGISGEGVMPPHLLCVVMHALIKIATAVLYPEDGSYNRATHSANHSEI